MHSICPHHLELDDREHQQKTEIPQYNCCLVALRDLGTIIGALFFSVGAIMGFCLARGYSSQSCGFVSCQLSQNVITLIGAIFFTATPSAKSILLASSIFYRDKSLLWEINMHIVGGIFFFLGAVVYIPFNFRASSEHNQSIAVTLGSLLYLMGSVLYVVVTTWSLYHALNLKYGSQMIFSASLCNVFGAFLFFLGSLLSFPSTFTPYCYVMFFLGEQCFIVSSIAVLYLQRDGSVPKQLISQSKEPRSKFTFEIMCSILKTSNSSAFMLLSLWPLLFPRLKQRELLRYGPGTCFCHENDKT